MKKDIKDNPEAKTPRPHVVRYNRILVERYRLLAFEHDNAYIQCRSLYYIGRIKQQLVKTGKLLKERGLMDMIKESEHPFFL